MIRHAEKDLHVLKYFSSVITVSEGRVINVTEPSLRYCPLACHFYPEFKRTDPSDTRSLCAVIQNAIETKIRSYGFFTKDRTFQFPGRVVPFGASEMLAASLKNGLLDTVVVVCDGAGTVITNSAETVQGIGARMNTLIFTSPIKGVQQKLKRAGCHIVAEDDTLIDQLKGVEKAVSLGYKKIGVTVAGFVADYLESIREFEKKKGISITILAVCTSGVSVDKIEKIRRHADLAWACASGEVHKRIGSVAKLQLSKQIPVFALTERGVMLVASYLNAPSLTRCLDMNKQYLIANETGNLFGYEIRENILPVETAKNLGAAQARMKGP